VLDEAVVDKRATEETAAKRAAKEATVMRVAEEWAAEEAVAKKAVEERAAGEAMVKAATAEVAGAAEGSPAPGQVPSVAGAKRAAAPSGSTPLAKRPYWGVWKPRFVQLSLPLSSSFFVASISYYPFCPGPVPPARLLRQARLP
jgi:hypothetical protein